MRVRLISVAIVLGLGIAGITLAQQPGEQPKQGARDRAKLRAQVVKLRAEIELLQLEHDADREYLRELLRSEKQTEMIPIVMSMTGTADVPGSAKAPGSVSVPKTDKEWAELETKGMLGDQRAAELFRKLFLAGEEANKKGEDAQKAMEAVAKALSSKGDVLQNYIDRKRKDFVKQAAELAEKQLSLAEAERQNQVVQ
jgi:hypothetical protein